jgi:hypothetical protein
VRAIPLLADNTFINLSPTYDMIIAPNVSIQVEQAKEKQRLRREEAAKAKAAAPVGQ